MSQAYRDVSIERVGAGRREAARDRAAAEEPLEVRLHGEPFAVIMRTPGNDRDLVAGFLLAEQVVRSAEDLEEIDTASPERSEGRSAVADGGGAPSAMEESRQAFVDVTLRGQRLADLPSLLAGRREVAQNASCGMCGRRSIDSLRLDAPPITRDWTVPASLVLQLPENLRARQDAFDQTGGLHAAGLFDRRGELLLVAEDVGRHNAVDKVVGRMFLQGRLPLSESILFVSGRTSFEIVQKAWLAGIPMLAAVSAPSTLAIEMADEAGITLIGFVRGDAFNVYTHGFRIAS